LTTKTGVTPISPDSPSLVDQVSHAVRRAILEGRLRPGEALSISDLAVDLDVSHSPVREALQRLSGQGLVQLRKARTAIVAPLDLGDLREIYRLRELIEVEAAGRSAAQIGERELESLERELALLSEAAIDSEEFWDAHNAFHHVLMAQAMTPRLDRLVSELWQAAERYIRIVFMETDVLFARPPRERHEPLLAAARTNDPVAMASALTKHLRSNERELVDSLKAILSKSSNLE
jgi:DNA-binding GntR family transcriptional regulator